jgi:hypothetical protein
MDKNNMNKEIWLKLPVLFDLTEEEGDDCYKCKERNERLGINTKCPCEGEVHGHQYVRLSDIDRFNDIGKNKVSILLYGQEDPVSYRLGLDVFLKMIEPFIEIHEP